MCLSESLSCSPQTPLDLTSQHEIFDGFAGVEHIYPSLSGGALHRLGSSEV